MILLRFTWKILGNIDQVLPAEDSVGVCSMMMPGRSIMVVCGCIAEILLSQIYIISNLWLTRLRNILKSSVCAKIKEIFK